MLVQMAYGAVMLAAIVVMYCTIQHHWHHRCNFYFRNTVGSFCILPLIDSVSE